MAEQHAGARSVLADPAQIEPHPGFDRALGRGLVAQLVEELGSLDQTEQVRAEIAALADRLPLPDRLPAEQLGTFHRIDDPTQIRSLAKSWHNCLGEYLHEVRVPDGD